MKRVIILLFLFAFISGITATREKIAQNCQSNSPDSLMIWEKLNIQSDPKINELLKQHTIQGKKSGTFSGFRVQIYFGSGENAHAKAIKIKNDFLASNPNVKTYLLFKSPDFIVRVGDYRTKSEALKLKKSMLFQYPNAFIVADEIALQDLIKITPTN
jgi:hypothetical protein